MVLKRMSGLVFFAAICVHAAEPPRMGLPREAEGVSLEVCRIVAPNSQGIRKEADSLVRLLQDRGAKVQVEGPIQALDDTGLRLRLPDDVKAGKRRETIILLGDIVANRALLPLYAAFLEFTDAYYPGGNGYVIRTALDGPARGVDAIVLGGSSEAGTAKALRRACEIVRGLKPGQPFPRTLEVELGGEAKANIPVKGTPGAPNAGYLYGLTGVVKFAEATKPAFVQPSSGTGYSSVFPTSYQEKAKQRVLDIQGITAFYDISDYALEPFLRSWALVCDSPVFSPSEVQAVHQVFFNTLVHDQDMYWRARGGQRIGSRHQTMGTSAFLSVVRHLLRRGRPNPAAAELLDRWNEECTAYFNNAVTTFHDDMEGLPSYHSVQPFLDYALENGAASFFKREKGMSPIEMAILRAYASVDNLGYYCGTGTYEEARPGTVKAGILFGYPLAIASCVTRDSRAAWLLRRFPGTKVSTWGLLSGYGAHAFAAGDAAPQMEPRDWLGVARAPLGEYRYSRLAHAPDASQSLQNLLPAPQERTFEKLCFRDTFAPDGQYLVLEGYQSVGADNVTPLDANSIIRYTDRGVPWLIANTDRQGNFYRNAVFVSDGETNQPGWAGCELVGQAHEGDAHLVVSRLGNYNGAEWTRNILWLRGRAFAVIDSIKFEKPGERQIFCTFRSAAPAELGGREWIARSGYAELHLLNADDAPMTSRRQGPEGAAMPTVLRQIRSHKASPGEAVHFRNLFYVSTPQRQQRLEIRSLDNNAMLILDAGKSDGCPSLFAVRASEGRLKVGPFESDALAMYIGPEGICMVGGTSLSSRSMVVKDMKNVDVPLLSTMWREARPPASESARQQYDPLRQAWQSAELQPERPIVPAPAVTSTESPASGALDDLVDGFVTQGLGEVSWRNAAGLSLTLDLRQPEEISAIELATGLIAPQNSVPLPEKMPKDWPATLQFSNDGFHKDIRGGQVVFRAGLTLEPIHKGTVYPMGRWRLSEVKQRARCVRITFPAGRVALREVFIRRAQGNVARFGPGLIADLDGDGTEEAVVTTNTGELLVLGRDGRKRWAHAFAGPVTCLNAGSLQTGHPTSLLVGTWEGRVYGFAADGRQEWMADLTVLGGDLTSPFSIALMKPDTEGKRTIVVGNYHQVSFISAEGKLISHSFAEGAFETMAMTDGMDLTGDGIEDALLYNVWATLSVVDGAKRITSRLIGCPRGEGLAFQRWRSATPADPAVLVASDNGLGIVRPVSGKYDWQKALNPMSCVAVADVDEDGQEEIVVGKRDGWLLVLSDKGDVKGKVVVGDEVRAIVPSLSRPIRLWLATGTDVRVMDGRLSTLARFDCKAQRIEAFGKDLILVMEEAGVVSAFRPEDNLAGR